MGLMVLKHVAFVRMLKKDIHTNLYKFSWVVYAMVDCVCESANQQLEVFLCNYVNTSKTCIYTNPKIIGIPTLVIMIVFA